MVMKRFANSAETTLTAPVGGGLGDTSISVFDANPFPNATAFYIRVDDELMLVTGGAGTVTWTVVRGEENTSRVPHSAGASVVQVLTAGVMNTLAVLTDDPGADRLLFWDDSADQVTWLTVGSGLSITGTTISAAGSGGTVTSIGLTVPSFMSVSGSPITTSGTLAVSLATQSANTVFAGPTTGGAAVPTLRALVTADLPDDGVTDVKLRNSAATSVIGRSANSTGDPADIAAGADGDVLRRSGTTLGFGPVATAGIADDAVTYAKIQNVSTTQRVLGRNSGGAGDLEEVTLSQLLDWVGSAAHGDILYRGASGWAPLAAGTAGQVLQTQGGGANPQWVTLARLPNVLHNGGGEVWQRGASVSTADDAYGCDRWYSLTQTGAVTQSQQTGTLGARYAIHLNQDQASAQRMGIAQIVEASDAIPYRGRTVNFQFMVKASTTTNIRFAILEWTGTADVVTSDVVNSWTNSTYTAGQFFLGSNLTVTAVSSSTSATTSFAQASVSGTVSASCNNLILFVWTEGTVAQTVALTVTECAVVDGAAVAPWLPRSVAEELAICQRYFWAWGVGTARYWGLSKDAANLYTLGCFAFPVEMRVAPSLVSGSWTASVGNNGTVVFGDATTKGGRFANASSNWTANTDMKLTARLSAEL